MAISPFFPLSRSLTHTHTPFASARFHSTCFLYFSCIIFDMAPLNDDGRNQWKAKMTKRGQNIKYVAKAFPSGGKGFFLPPPPVVVVFQFQLFGLHCSNYVMHSIYGLFWHFSCLQFSNDEGFLMRFAISFFPVSFVHIFVCVCVLFRWGNYPHGRVQ